MRKKLREKAGLTVIEMLAATVVLVLLALMLNTGLQMALNTYETMIAQSEVELLLSTAVDSLADELRYAQKVDGENGSGYEYKIDPVTGKGTNGPVGSRGFAYTSGSFGNVTNLKVAESGDNKGQIMVTVKNGASPENLRVLSTGAYGNKGISYKEYEVTAMKVTYNKPASGDTTFTIELAVATVDGKISAGTPEGGVTVRCLNPPAEAAPAGGT